MEAINTCRTAFAWGAAVAVTITAAPAFAGFWTPLDTVPAPNFIIGMDTSVTMGITPDCSSCHSPSNPVTRLNEAKTDILATLPMFQNYFVFGGYRYSGCGYAKINSGTRVMPTPNNPATSYGQVLSMVNGAGHCGSREDNYPSMGGGTGCITPTPACMGDQPVIEQLMTSGLPGLNIPAPAIADPTVDVACDTPSPPWPNYNLAASLLGKFAGFGWPRWTASLNASQVINDLCNPLQNVFNQVRSELNSCFTTTSSVWDMSFLDSGFGGWCTPGIIAGNACTASSPLDGTCVCDDTLSGCASSMIPSTECSKIMTWKARQQVAVCEMYSTAQPDRFGTYFQSQADNIANGQCRENVGIFITDGYEGHKPGVAAEAIDAQNFYRSADGLSNMFVFRISSVFNSAANRMQRYVSSNQAGGPTMTAYAATDRATMQESFAKVLSRIYKGVYTGANIGMSRYQDRAVFHSFTVPGYNTAGPVSDDYLGFPSRISVHAVDPTDGSISATPRFESDWTSRVTASPGCGGYQLRGTSGLPGYTSGGLDIARLGPGGTFFNGVDRDQTLAGGSTDRDGDDVPDMHPSITYGRSFGFASGAALVVDAPEELKATTSAGEIGAMVAFQSDPAIQQRPRVIYYTDGGYLIGIHGGTYVSGPPPYGNQTMAFTYDDGSAPAGAEVLRYQPGWLDPSDPANSGLSYGYDYGANPLIQQPLITGELIAKEVFVRVGASEDFRTVLVANQGREGPGFFALDITDPCTPPAFATDIRLPPNNYASAEPTLYLMRSAGTPSRRAVLITTGGLGGEPTMFAYDIVTGALVDSVGLPAGASYPTAPVCVDVTGEGTVTHCYALREDGLLARVDVGIDSFGPDRDITPVDGLGNTPTMSAGRRYYTSPVAYFGQDGEVNLVFGSGDFEHLTSPASANAVFRAKDPNTRQEGVPANPAELDNVCVPVAGNSEGVIPLGPGERVLSKPIVQEGVVAWTTYRSTTNGCVAGTGYLYAMDFETCEDLLATGNRPSGQAVGPGIPTSPVLHSQSQRLLVQSSAGPTGGQTQRDEAQTRGGGMKWLKPLYWRLEIDNP